MTTPDPSAQSGAGDPAQSGQGGTGTEAGTGAQSGAGAAGEPSTGTSTADPGAQSGAQPGLTVAEADALRQRMQAADKRAGAAEAELRQLKDKDLPELEKLKRDFAEATAATEKLKADLAKTRLETAFLRDNTYKWRNPDAALKLADLSRVEINEDGTVTGLKLALDALAKSDPYLIDDNKGEGEQGNGTPPGAPPVNGTTGGRTSTSTEALAKRFPQMRTRLG